MPDLAENAAQKRLVTISEALELAAARGISTSRNTLIRRVRERGCGRKFGAKILVELEAIERLLDGEPLTASATAA